MNPKNMLFLKNNLRLQYNRIIFQFLFLRQRLIILYSYITKLKEMSESQFVSQALQQAKQIRQNSRTSCVELQNYLYYQYLKLNNRNSSVWACGLCARPKAETKKQFRRAFKTLSKVQQAQFYLMSVKNVEKFLNTRVKNVGDMTQVIEDTNALSDPIIKMKFDVMDGNVYKKYTQVNAEILTKEKVIRIPDAKQQYDLHNYILRKSKSKNRSGLVFQSTQSYTNSETVRLVFSNVDFQDSFKTIEKIWTDAQYQNVKKILVQENKYPRRVQGRNRNSTKNNFGFEQQLQPITPKLFEKKQGGHDMNQLRQSIQQSDKMLVNGNKSARLSRIQNTLVPNQLMQSLNTFKNFNEQSFGVYYNKEGTKVRKSFEFNEKSINIEMILNAIDDVKQIRKRKRTVVQLKHLSSIPSEKTNLYREVNLFQNLQYEFTYFRHSFRKNGVIYFFEKSVDLQQFKNANLNMTKSTINYCIWRIKRVGQKIQLLVQADVIYNKKIKDPQKITSMYIGQFVNYLNEESKEQKKQVKNQTGSIGSDEFQNQYLSEISNNEEEFFTVTGSLSNHSQMGHGHNNQQGNVQMVGTMLKKPKNLNLDPQKLVQQDFGTKQTATDQSQNKKQYMFKHKYQQIPLQKGTPAYLKQPEGHILWGKQWKISDTGQLVNLNHEKIKMQSSVLKLVLQRMGRNLLTGKSIMSMSLPIQIFGIDSNIERIARGFIYAPIFLEKASVLNDPVQRMKYIICFGLGFSISYIKMQKPFNPVIGETFQGIIDGCPVYGEQISHHPPISSMLMIGRGYRAYGNFQAKVEMGMNSASGINEGFNNVQFQKDGTIVRFNTPPGEMYGIIIGDRKLTLAKKSYYIDETNRIFCEIAWRKQKNNGRQFCNMNDFFSGKIVKIKSGVNINDYKKIKPKDFDIQYGQIHGRFDSKVFFEDDLIFDIDEDAPLQIQDYVPSLESDSRWRKDIIQRKKLNYNLAQQAKEEIQNLQRRDRKLRKNPH